MTMQEYTRRSYYAQNRCRVSLRRKGAELAIFFTNEVAAEAGIAVGERVRLLYDTTRMAIIPATDGAFRVRKELQSGAPHLLVPIGVNKPFNCTFDRGGPLACEHQIDDHGLVLTLPKEVRLTTNS
jgi:hypothetical protein